MIESAKHAEMDNTDIIFLDMYIMFSEESMDMLNMIYDCIHMKYLQYNELKNAYLQLVQCDLSFCKRLYTRECQRDSRHLCV